MYTRLPVSAEFVAATIATKQIEHLLAEPGPEAIAGIERLLNDPARPALADGTTAAQLIGPGWTDYVADVASVAAPSIAFARSEGTDALLRISGWYARSEDHLWWGTPEWDDHVTRWARTASAGAALTGVLRTEPELVDHLTLTRVLGPPGSSGHHLFAAAA